MTPPNKKNKKKQGYKKTENFMPIHILYLYYSMGSEIIFRKQLHAKKHWKKLLNPKNSNFAKFSAYTCFYEHLTNIKRIWNQHKILRRCIDFLNVCVIRAFLQIFNAYPQKTEPFQTLCKKYNLITLPIVIIVHLNPMKIL
jgi:hypothetical protein